MSNPKNSELFNLFYRLSMVPRWSDVTPNYEDSTASHSYRVAVLSLLIAITEKEKYGKKLDLTKVLGRALYHDVNEVITGPIKHSTKKNGTVSTLIKELEKDAAKSLADYVSDSLKKYFYDYIVDAEDESPEGRIIELADTLDAFIYSEREIQAYNHFNFPKASDDTREALLDSGCQTVIDMVHMFQDDNSGYRKLLLAILKMDEIKRWTGRFNTFPDNDATHTFRAAAMGLYFALYEKEKHGIEIDIETLVGKILFHDLPEAITGDIKGPVKHQSKEIKEAFEKFENDTAIEIVSWAPEYLKPYIERYIINPKDNTPEGIRVDIVDKIDAMLKSLIEMKRNSSEYEEVYRKQLANIQAKYFEFPAVKFFLSTILHDLYFASDFEK